MAWQGGVASWCNPGPLRCSPGLAGAMRQAQRVRTVASIPWQCPFRRTPRPGVRQQLRRVGPRVRILNQRCPHKVRPLRRPVEVWGSVAAQGERKHAGLRTRHRRRTSGHGLPLPHLTGSGCLRRQAPCEVCAPRITPQQDGRQGTPTQHATASVAAAHLVAGNLTSLLYMMSAAVCASSSTSKGGCPVTSSYASTPAAQMSTGGP